MRLVGAGARDAVGGSGGPVFRLAAPSGPAALVTAVAPDARVLRRLLDRALESLSG
ncbi:hypothetical protein GA0115233_100996 [Streptomyces sp. DI166]|uniref:hypothetical protein n=1 Tax=unclassified Streptomyces TaxID=2593676 RepID=UPI0007F3BE77|nr:MULTISPECIES: hypothetical protein [unclassified Streptomyces]SBT89449.1 hypothetical protein GA0115233_100996 [Streptomyces sp. DI166]